MKLLNNEKDKKLLDILKEYLNNSNEFIIISAFITIDGIQPFLTEFYNLKEQNVKGKIITGDYLTFTDPKALKKLKEFNNIDLKINLNNLHVKGYFFKIDDSWHSLIGSANLTIKALKINNEWLVENRNIQLEEVKEIKKIDKESIQIDDTFLNSYTKIYQQRKEFEKTLKANSQNEYSRVLKIPYQANSMQKQAVEQFKKLKNQSATKSLLISATGTGKTVTSAFITREFNPKKMLFLVHREQILSDAKKTFETIFPDKKIALYNANFKETEEYDFLFSTIQILAKQEKLEKFTRDYFDLIIIDETHHAIANTYNTILNFFQPKMLFGMTATPIRGDGLNIYKYFDYNICHEIGLYEALEEKLICPFHYYGVEDSEENIIFNKINISQRSEQIIKFSNLYGYSGKYRSGLIFVSNIQEGEALTQELNKKNIPTKFLSAKDSFSKRETIISEFKKYKLEFLITVDIFNEGVDLPFVNQIILLRPTKSAVIYIQQIGRGLRLKQNKDYLVILDFIKNYASNFLIPVALSQDKTLSKNNLQKFLTLGTDLLPGDSTLSFTKLAKERILSAIEKANFHEFKIIKDNYLDLKYKLGRIPYLEDFRKNGYLNPDILLNNSSMKTYFNIIQRIEKIDYHFTEEMTSYIEYLTALSPGKRVHEWIVLNELLKNKAHNLFISEINKIIESYLGINNQMAITINSVKHLSRNIFQSYSMFYKYKPLISVVNNNQIKLETKFKKALENEEYKRFFQDLIQYNLNNVNSLYKQKTEESIIVGEEYSKLEAYYYSGNNYSNGHQVAGYYKTERNEILLFCTNNSTFTKYDNKQQEGTIEYYSKNNRFIKRDNKLTLEGEIAFNQYKMRFFIRENQKDNFTYMGYIHTKEYEEIKKDQKSCVKYLFTFDYNSK